MTVRELEAEVQSAERDGKGKRGELVPGSKYLYIGEIFDEGNGYKYHILPQMIALHDRAREIMGVPSNISSGYRTRKTQDGLISKFGKATFSPHTMAAALDIDINPDNIQVAEQWANAFYKAAKELNYQKPRIGIRKYKGHFIHVDMVFTYFKEFDGPYDWPDDSEDSPDYMSAIAIKRNWRENVSW